VVVKGRLRLLFSYLVIVRQIRFAKIRHAFRLGISHYWSDTINESGLMSQQEKALLSGIRRLVCVALLPALSWENAQAAGPKLNESGTKEQLAIPIEQLGTAFGQLHQRDGLSIRATFDGARLRCALQRLEGRASPDGVWLAFTTAEFPSDQFRVKASALEHDCVEMLPATGIISVAGQVIRLQRASVVEEYTVSADGIRQDFVVSNSASGAGELVVRLDVSGAWAEQTHYGAKLVLTGSSREIAYSRLKVTDASGTELNARLDVTTAHELTITVEDAKATYPIRIDPTFSDVNWVSINSSIPGADSFVNAAVMDDSGNLYIGGYFTVVGGVVANFVAKWNGSNWSTLGQGLNDRVLALAYPAMTCTWGDILQGQPIVEVVQSRSIGLPSGTGPIGRL